MNEFYLVKHIMQLDDGALYIAGNKFSTLREAEKFSKCVKSKGIYFVTEKPMVKVIETNIKTLQNKEYYK